VGVRIPTRIRVAGASIESGGGVNGNGDAAGQCSFLDNANVPRKCLDVPLTDFGRWPTAGDDKAQSLMLAHP
jgi:hypothetical protein